MRKLFLIISLVLLQASFAQTFSLSKNDDTLNKIDANGLRQGKWVITNEIKKLPGYPESAKVEEGLYVDNKKTGVWTEYFPNGNLKSKITFENNRANGYMIMYNENGKIREEGTWKAGRWVGKYKLYYDNGEVQHEWNHNASGKREGVQKYYYENGQVMIEGDWKEGKESGILKEYHENGDLKSEKNFANGDLDVASVKTYEPKKPVLAKKEEKQVVAPKIIAKQDEKPNIPSQQFTGEGYWKLFNANRQVSKDGVFKSKRLMDGKVYHYNEDGILVRIAVYKDGFYVGDAPIEESK